jgi:trehalose 6-phosphate phosphatase
LPDSVRRFQDPAEVAAEAARRIGDHHALLLTDFDGTLADLAPTPDLAFVETGVQAVLEAVAAHPGITLGVVSGRRLEDVSARVGHVAEFVAGLHGLEIDGHGLTFHHGVLESVAPIIERLDREARRHLDWCPGCLIENKEFALTCHVRQAPPDLGELALEEFEALAEPYLETRKLRLLIGAQAMELLPSVDWDKGRAVEWIRTRVSRTLGYTVPVIYLGDDRTDEDAFTDLGEGDFAIGVGHRPHTHMIDARLEGPGAVGEFLGEMTRIIGRQP